MRPHALGGAADGAGRRPGTCGGDVVGAGRRGGGWLAGAPAGGGMPTPDVLIDGDW
ncbi:MAG: hypothetical protein H6708_22885 [Kofleriaceae bacterium]|nr:hypothetical protein [Kofleriaceae bacterium]